MPSKSILLAFPCKQVDRHQLRCSYMQWKCLKLAEINASVSYFMLVFSQVPPMFWALVQFPMQFLICDCSIITRCRRTLLWKTGCHQLLLQLQLLSLSPLSYRWVLTCASWGTSALGAARLPKWDQTEDLITAGLKNKPNLTSSKVTRGELWPEVSAWSPRTQRRHAVQRLIARSTHTVLSVSVIDLSRYSESSTEVFWWNASRDNTFSSTWHSLAFFIFSVFIWFTAFLLTLLCFHSWKHMWGFRVLSLLPSFLPGGKDLGNDLNFLSFEIVKTNWIHFWHSKAKTLLSIHRNPYTSYTTACIVKTGDRVIFWPSNLKLIFWS